MKGRAAARRRDEGLGNFLQDVENILKESRDTDASITLQRHRDQLRLHDLAVSNTQAADEVCGQLGAEREKLEQELAEHLLYVRDLETSTISMGDYLISAQKRARELDAVLKVGHPSGMIRQGWSRVDVEDFDMDMQQLAPPDLDGALSSGGARSATGPSGRARGYNLYNVAVPRGHEGFQSSFQHIQEDLKTVMGHPRKIQEETANLQGQLEEAYREKLRLERAVADKRHAAALTETLANLRREGTSPALAAISAGEAALQAGG